MKYEKYLIWLVTSLIFCTAFMWAAKTIFNIILPFHAWNLFLQVTGILSLLVAIASVWVTGNSEKRNAAHAEAIRKEEKILSILEQHERAIIKQDEIQNNQSQDIRLIEKAIDDIRNKLGRLNAQVQERESEVLLARKLTIIENKLHYLESDLGDNMETNG